jgi:hypothetical protein
MRSRRPPPHSRVVHAWKRCLWGPGTPFPHVEEVFLGPGAPFPRVEEVSLGPGCAVSTRGRGVRGALVRPFHAWKRCPSGLCAGRDGAKRRFEGLAAVRGRILAEHLARYEFQSYTLKKRVADECHEADARRMSEVHVTLPSDNDAWRQDGRLPSDVDSQLRRDR